MIFLPEAVWGGHQPMHASLVSLSNQAILGWLPVGVDTHGGWTWMQDLFQCFNCFLLHVSDRSQQARLGCLGGMADCLWGFARSVGKSNQPCQASRLYQRRLSKIGVVCSSSISRSRAGQGGCVSYEMSFTEPGWTRWLVAGPGVSKANGCGCKKTVIIQAILQFLVANGISIDVLGDN